MCFVLLLYLLNAKCMTLALKVAAPMGPPGNPGATGDIGLPGQSLTGVTGVNGLPGVNGRTGATGAPGLSTDALIYFDFTPQVTGNFSSGAIVTQDSTWTIQGVVMNGVATIHGCGSLTANETVSNAILTVAVPLSFQWSALPNPNLVGSAMIPSGLPTVDRGCLISSIDTSSNPQFIYIECFIVSWAGDLIKSLCLSATFDAVFGDPVGPTGPRGAPGGTGPQQVGPSGGTGPAGPTVTPRLIGNTTTGSPSVNGSVDFVAFTFNVSYLICGGGGGGGGSWVIPNREFGGGGGGSCLPVAGAVVNPNFPSPFSIYYSIGSGGGGGLAGAMGNAGSSTSLFLNSLSGPLVAQSPGGSGGLSYPARSGGAGGSGGGGGGYNSDFAEQDSVGGVSTDPGTPNGSPSNHFQGGNGGGPYGGVGSPQFEGGGGGGLLLTGVGGNGGDCPLVSIRCNGFPGGLGAGGGGGSTQLGMSSDTGYQGGDGGTGFVLFFNPPSGQMGKSGATGVFANTGTTGVAGSFPIQSAPGATGLTNQYTILLTSSQTLVLPQNAKLMCVTAVGGGGGGGVPGTSGGGGGGSGFVNSSCFSLLPLSIGITIGQGGVGGTQLPGGTTIVTSPTGNILLSAPGGQGGFNSGQGGTGADGGGGGWSPSQLSLGGMGSFTNGLNAVNGLPVFGRAGDGGNNLGSGCAPNHQANAGGGGGGKTGGIGGSPGGCSAIPPTINATSGTLGGGGGGKGTIEDASNNNGGDGYVEIEFFLETPGS